MKKINVMFMAGVIGMMTLLNSCDYDICGTAADIISEEYAARDGASAPYCTKVTLDRQVSNNAWNASATLSNGQTIPVFVKCEGDMVYVDLRQQMLKELNEACEKAGQEAAEEFEREMQKVMDEAMY